MHDFLQVLIIRLAYFLEILRTRRQCARHQTVRDRQGFQFLRLLEQDLRYLPGIIPRDVRPLAVLFEQPVQRFGRSNLSSQLIQHIDLFTRSISAVLYNQDQVSVVRDDQLCVVR